MMKQKQIPGIIITATTTTITTTTTTITTTSTTKGTIFYRAKRGNKKQKECTLHKKEGSRKRGVKQESNSKTGIRLKN